MTIEVRQLQPEELSLAGDMVSPSEPPVFWMVLDGTEIYCVCVSKEHAGAIAKGLQDAKSLGEEFDRQLKAFDVYSKKLVVARCANSLIRRVALNALMVQLQPTTDSSIPPVHP